MEKEIVLFEDNGIKLEVPVTPEEETVWLNRTQMAELFDRDIKTIGKHIANARREELEGQVGSRKICDYHSAWSNRRKNTDTHDRIL